MPMRLGLNRTLGGAIGAIAAVIAVTVLVVLLALRWMGAEAEQRSQANTVLQALGAFAIAMRDQETGIRGYIVTGNPDNLQPYHDGLAAEDKATSALRSLLVDRHDQSILLDAARAAADAWQQSIARPVLADMSDAATRTPAADLERSGEGKRLFDLLRSRLAAIQTAEEQRLQRSDANFRRASMITIAAISVGALISLLFCLGVGLAIQRSVSTPLLTLADTMRRLTAQDLRVPIPSMERHDEIGEMARAVQVFKANLIEVERLSLRRAIADTVPALIGYVDRNRRVRFLNQAFAQWFDFGGVDVRKLTDHPVETVFAAMPLPGFPDQFESALAGYPSRKDQTLAPSDGARRDVEVLYQPHRLADGTILGAVVLISDITQRKELDGRLAEQARELRRSNEELEQFAYVASHDLKAPLRGIDNLVTWIEEDIGEALTGDTRTNMNLLHNRVRRLENLLDDLLQYSRAGRRFDAAEPIDTHALVSDLSTLVSPPEGFRITIDDSLPILMAPLAPLTQVFQNLIGNAIKHHDHPGDGHVWVRAETAADDVTFLVADDGPGIPEQFRDRVFGMFQTLKPRDEVEGSGMGLAIVKKLVEAHGGSITLGERDGRGLAVRFTWPTTPRRSAP